MNNTFKPQNYNSLSPYLIADDANQLFDLLKIVFGAVERRKFLRDDGSIAHAELQIDDSIVMISNSSETYPANKTMLHLYVPDALATFRLAVQHGCKPIEEPTNKPGDPDRRGAFYDCAGNYWAVSTQVVENK